MTITIEPSADDWAWYGEERRVYPRNKIRDAANDNETPLAILEYRNQPDHPYEPLQSNWSTTPSGIVEYDSKGEDQRNVVRLPQELDLEVTPSIEGILRAMRHEWQWSSEDGGRVDAIGSLRFSDGQQREPAYKLGPDGKVGVYLRRMPSGAMLGTTEKSGAARGGGGASPASVSISNSNLTARLLAPDAKPRPFKPRGTIRGGKSFTAAESRANLEAAIANTQVMPSVTKCPPGIANGTARASDQFIGMKIGSTGRAGAIGWVDFHVAARDREEWLATIEELDENTRAVLDAAIHARSYAEVGIAAGQSPEYARRKGGKAVLMAANDNLQAAVSKAAA